ncbi:MAG: Holliday junction branch migration protein RuvA [Gemmatimonadota bacterium]|nr:MAG: Holliday junction branch migration protein RuvA [Gemmatimonadota bacterium]
MIAAVFGRLASKSGDRVVVATAGGVSYEIAVPIGVLERLPPTGAEVELNTVPIVREDGWALYGFDDVGERTVFQRLLAVNGVGPRLALAIVSTLGNRVIRVLKEGDIAALCTVPGVGKKTAERIALELKDKLRDVAHANGVTVISLPAEQAVNALVNLGYPSGDADRAVRTVLAERAGAEAAELIRGALQLLARRK